MNPNPEPNPDGELDPDLREAMARLVRQAGLRGEPCLIALAGGANNRVFRVEAGGDLALLKIYFRHPGDPRDRLGAEFGFCSFAWGHGVKCLPQPLACDRGASLALYEYLPGKRVQPGEVSAEALRQAVAFYRAVNRHRDTRAARALPEGSEACFSMAAHLACVDRRVRRLAGLQSGAVVAEAERFVREELVPRWEQVANPRCDRAGEQALSEADRRLSPSDFGFHNALRGPDGCLRFFDFEYAGWDDPAKLVCDFFCQPAVPVPLECWEEFAGAVAEDLAEPARQRARFAALLPVYRVKWCCILLNDFLPEGSARRRFAHGPVALAEQRERQLEKARDMLRRLDGDTRTQGASTP